MIAYRMTIYKNGKKTNTWYCLEESRLTEKYDTMYGSGGAYDREAWKMTNRIKEIDTDKLPKWIQRALIRYNSIAQV